MNLDFSEEQVMLRDMAARLCDDHHGSTVIRDLERDPAGFSQTFWRDMAEGGLCGIAVPEAHGGIGLGSLETVLLHQEMGRALAPSPHLVSCVIAAALLQASGTQSQRDSLLPQIASGEKIVVPAWQEPGVSAELGSVRARLEGGASAQRLSGEKVLVPFANSADYLLVPAIDDRGAIQVALVQTAQAALRVQPNHADQALYAVSLQDVEVSPDDLLQLEELGQHWDMAMLRGQIAIAAQAIGGASCMLQMTNDYAREREQFGQPIGALQAIDHYLADRATELEGARYLTYQAAWACDQDEGSPVDWQQLALMARLQASAVFRRSTVTGVQVHGGMGFSAEADPQLYYRRAKHLQLMHWDPRYIEQRIASGVFH